MNFYLAPLAEITSKEFRLLCYEGGADACFSEMISAKAVTLRNRKTIALSEIDEIEPRTALQFFGGDPEVIKEAAEKISSPWVLFNFSVPIYIFLSICITTSLE